jgi:hypothetical protein
MSDDLPPLNLGEAPDGLSLTDDVVSTDPDGIFCVVCGTQLVYGGRGPKPKYCAEHKRNQSSGSGSTVRRASRSMAGIEQSLAEGYRFLGLGVSAFSEMAGMEIAGHADDLAKSWVIAAESNPKLRKTLEKMAMTGGMSGVIMAHLMVALPIAKHHGLFDKIGPQSRR